MTKKRFVFNDQTKKNGKLTALPVFDSEDKISSLIEWKVNRGFIASCSMGTRFNREDLKYIDGVLVLEKCELHEVSIVSIPCQNRKIGAIR